MAYTLGNKCAKNLCKRLVLLQLIIENVVTCFFWNTVYYVTYVMILLANKLQLYICICKIYAQSIGPIFPDTVYKHRIRGVVHRVCSRMCCATVH